MSDSLFNQPTEINLVEELLENFSERLSTWEQDIFLPDIQARLYEGQRLSKKQSGCLHRIADRVMTQGGHFHGRR